MKVEEAIKLINNSWNCYSLESAGYLLTECKLINRQDYNNSNKWYIMATDIYKVEDGIILFYTPLFNKFIRKCIKINL